MSRFYIEGFEAGGIQPPAWSMNAWGAAPYTNKPKLAAPPSGGNEPLGNKCLQVYWNQGIELDLSTITGRGNLPSFYMKARFHYPDAITNAGLFRIISDRNDATVGTFSFTATGTKYVAASTTYSGAPGAVSINEWHVMELWFKLSTDSATSDGEIDFWIDGVQHFSNYAAKTNGISGAGSLVAPTSVSKLYFIGGYQYKWASWDDLVFDTTSSLGVAVNSSVVGYDPSSDVTTNWTVPAGSNYSKIGSDPTDDISTSVIIDSEYITTNGAGTKDLYGTSKDFIDGTGTMSVQVVQAQVRARRQGPCPATKVRPYLKIGGSEYPGDSDLVPYSNFQTRYSTWTQNPDTLVDWTEGDLTSLETGVESIAS